MNACAGSGYPYNGCIVLCTFPSERCISSCSVPVQGLADEADINSEDGEVVARGQALLDMALEKTHAMGGTHMVGVIYSAIKKYPGPCSTAARQNVVSSLQVHFLDSSDRGILDARSAFCADSREGDGSLLSRPCSAAVRHAVVFHACI